MQLSAAYNAVTTDYNNDHKHKAVIAFHISVPLADTL